MVYDMGGFNYIELYQHLQVHSTCHLWVNISGGIIPFFSVHIGWCLYVNINIYIYDTHNQDQQEAIQLPNCNIFCSKSADFALQNITDS